MSILCGRRSQSRAFSLDFEDKVQIEARIVPGAVLRQPGSVPLRVTDDARVANGDILGFVRVSVDPEVRGMHITLAVGGRRWPHQ